MANEGPITKIYQIQVLGFEESKAVFDKMSAELAKLKKQKQDLDKTLSSTVDAGKVELLTKKQQELTLTIIEQTKKVKELENQTRVLQSAETEQVSGIAKARTAYMELVKAYKEAKANSEAMEAQFGAESVEAKEAAAAFVLYEDELRKINALRKGNIADAKVTTPTPTDIPFTHNLNTDGTVKQPELIAGTTALNEYDKAQQAVANSAVAMGESVTVAGQEVKATQPAFSAVVGSLDQYTGSLRQNITAQIENAQAIAANKAAQKEITESIKESGGATQIQIERLAALKEEAIILEQSNKSLTTTIRNQAREFVSATGSIEESRAKVNQLQQAYAQLSDAERAQPFGQAIKDEIDVLEPKLKELEAQIGLFQRNVGNYPSNFTGAFKVLDNELDTLKGKLVQGNFSGTAFDDLTRKTAVLEQVTGNLNQTFKTTTQEQTAFKEAARAVATEFGTESVVFQNFSKEVQAGNTKLKETDVALNVVSGSGKKATNVFQAIFSGLRNIANIIPGIGLSGLILLLIAPLEALASKVGDVFTGFVGASKSTAELKNHLEEMNTAVHESQKEFVDAFTAVETLRLNVDLARQGFLNKDDVLKQYNDTLGKTYGKVKSLDDVEQILVKNGDAYVKMTLFKAAANIALQKAAEEAFKAEEDRRQSEQRVTEFTTANQKKGLDAEERGLNQFLEKTAKAEQSANKVRSDAAIKTQEDIAKSFLKSAAEIAKNTGGNLLGNTDTKTIKERADKLSVAEQNAIKLIDATYKEELAVENTRFADIEKVHQASFDEEITHVKRVESITVEELNSKISLLSKRKNLNSEELAQLAEFKEKRSEIELQTNKQIQEIEKKRFADQNKDLQASLDANILQAKQAQQKVLDDPGASNVERARANLEFIDTEIIAYKQYYTQLLDLNDNYSKEELQKVRDHIAALTAERNRGLTRDLEAEEKDIEARGAREITDINITYQTQRNAILSNEKLTEEQRTRLIEQLSSANNVTILTKELETLNEQLKVKFEMLMGKGLTSDAEYEKLHLAALAKAGDLEAAVIAANNKKRDDAFKAKPHNVQEAASQGVDSLLGVDPNSPEGQAVAEVTTQAFSLATDAMHQYYDAERARIQQSLDLNLKRLDFEEQQVKARATSQAELDSIDKQYAAKKAAAQKAAGEETKKSKRAELRIALVTEIANDAVAAAAYPFPFNLGIFAVMAALAYGRYALGLSAINSAQFAHGGEVPKRGGKFGGKQHSQGGTKFNYQNEQFEAEVDELAIIRTRNAPARNKVFQIMGTHQQIASQLNVLGGGIEFAPGAKLKRFAEGGFLGSSLQAPVFIASSSNGGSSTNNKELLDEIRNLRTDQQRLADETSKRIDRMQVVQVTSTVTKAQAKQVQQRAIGTIG